MLGEGTGRKQPIVSCSRLHNAARLYELQTPVEIIIKLSKHLSGAVSTVISHNKLHKVFGSGLPWPIALHFIKQASETLRPQPW